MEEVGADHQLTFEMEVAADRQEVKLEAASAEAGNLVKKRTSRR